ncbi:glycoside hydrolase family 18 and carbohydrate-binding module family 5 protein [Phlebopus sp. FC_14]|nr:glycoside hydrolase family 18 and carbohydrate-binding module family 5 protein [Phlebopus sp. FC_14]
MLRSSAITWLSAATSIFISTLGPCQAVPTVSPSRFKLHARSRSYVQAAYFTNWGIYGANFQPSDINPGDLTHILYAFADVSPDSGEIGLTDPWADEQKHFPGDSWTEPGNNLYGCLKQLYLLKLSHRHLKVLLSVGGWTYGQDGHFSFITDPVRRATFVSSAVRMIKDYGFDGIDIDFEYPTNNAQGQGFADLLTSLRSSFDELASTNGDTVPYELMAAVPAGSQYYAFYQVPQMNKALSYWNLMSYDYAGSWLTWADNQANLYGGSRTGVSTDAAVKHYISSGASSGKLTMGIPLYGRVFDNTDGIGKPYNGVGPGVYSYKDLPIPGAQVFDDLQDVASYSYDATKRELVSYDDPHIVKIKAEYVMNNNMAGCMFWELSDDRSGSLSLVQIAANVFDHLDQTLNHIRYPDSKWDNIRNNMGISNSPSTPTISSSASVPTTTSSGKCAGVPSWQNGVVYTGGKSVVYNSILWTAKWWTENDVPGGQAGVWTDDGKCT